jgi:hypothetical protein
VHPRTERLTEGASASHHAARLAQASEGKPAHRHMPALDQRLETLDDLIEDVF